MVILLALSATGAHGQCHYDVTVIRYDCDSPPFDSSPTYATALNEHGHVVGYVDYCVIGPQLPFIWTPEDGLQLIELPAGAGRGWAADINDAGAIVGTVDYPGLGFRGFYKEPGEEMVILPPAGTGGWNQAFALNQHSAVVGTRSIGSELNPETAYSWDVQTGFTDLGILSGPETHATDVLEDGSILGWLGTGASSSRAFLWQDGKSIELGPVPGGSTSSPLAINEGRTIVGSGRLPLADFPLGGPRGFVWRDGTFTVLEQTTPYLLSSVTDINAVDQMTVSAWYLDDDPSESRGYVFQGTDLTDLNDLTDPVPGQVIQSASAINGNGVILARAEGAISLILTPRDRPLADINGDCKVNLADLMFVFNDWGTAAVRSDTNADGTIDALDFLAVLAGWTQDHS